MKNIIKISFAVLTATTIGLAGACAQAPASTEDLVAELESRITALEKELSAKEATIDTLKQEIQEKASKIEELEKALEKLAKSVPTTTPPPPPPPSPAAQKPPTNIIKDLAYIKGSIFGYSDDADPEDEGIEISFLWYDTKSTWIIFKNIPISVDIELYPRGFDMKTGKYTLGKCIYKGEAQIDSSLSRIRIPFEDINATPAGDYTPGSLAKVTIHTPQQGDYSIECVGVVGFEAD